VDDLGGKLDADCLRRENAPFVADEAVEKA
jgi:hypothetical protein